MDEKQAWAWYKAMLLYDGGPPITSAGDMAILDHVHMGGVANSLLTHLSVCTAGGK